MSTNKQSDSVANGFHLRNALMEVQGQLSLPQLVVLLTVRIEPGLSVNDLAERLGIPQQSASRYVSMLAGRYQTEPDQPLFEPLLLQKINDTDPRSRALHVTAAGEALLKTLVSIDC